VIVFFRHLFYETLGLNQSARTINTLVQSRPRLFPNKGATSTPE
jgi:hypothetical protein